MKPWYLTASALIMLALTASCTSDSSRNDEPHVKIPKTVTLKIYDSGFTRADVETEKEISTLSVVFLKGNNVMKIEKGVATENSGEFKVDVPGSVTNCPDGILVYANCDVNESSFEALRSKTLSQISSENGLAMSNVTVFDDENSKSSVIPVSFANFTEHGDKVTVQLERLVGKITLAKDDSFADNAEVVVDGKNAGVKLSVKGWYLSGIDKETHLFKQHGTTLPEGNWWKGVSGALPVTHWAISANFDKEKFPTSDSEVSNSGIEFAKFNGTPNLFQSTVYCHETTRPQSAHSVPNALPSIIIVGTYRLADDTSETPQTLYRLADGSFVNEAGLWDIVSSNPAMLVKTDGETTVEDLKKLLTINCHVENEPDRVVCFALKEGLTDSDLQPFGKTVSDIESIDTYLKERYGYAEKYHEGACYFPIPIQHKNFQSGVSQDKQPLGAYGVVRNHQYTITLKGISGIGLGVATENSYLLQSEYDARTPQYSIAISASITDWIEVDTQVIE